MMASREIVLDQARALEQGDRRAAAALLLDLLREIETTAAALDLLTQRFAEIAAERDELVLRDTRKAGGYR